MKCVNCGFENRDDFAFCANCGAANATVLPTKSVAEVRALEIVKSKLFLTICILITVASGLSIINEGLQIIPLLLAIFMWMAYANGTKDKVDFNDFRKISGTVYANYVIVNVAAIIVIVCGVVVGFLLSSLSFLDLPEFIHTISPDFEEFLTLLPDIGMVAISMILGLIFVFAGTAMLIINILGMRKIHFFAKEFYNGIITGDITAQFANSARSWLIFFAIVDGISAVSTISVDTVGGLIQGCLVAAMILTIKIIDKYILVQNNNLQ